jgi:predicted AlkP superfamily phosphohydrolase/phosphomutase
MVLLAGCGETDRGVEVFTRPQPVVVVALDGFEPSLARRLMSEGRLPHLRRLVDNGVFATIDCIVGSISPVVWTTVATGAAPERHGITGFTVDGAPVTSSLRKSPAFWNILPRFGLEVATIGWLASWPAEADSGIVVSDRAHWGRFGDKVAPEGVVDLKRLRLRPRSWTDLLPRYTSYPFDPSFESLPETDPAYGPNFLVKNRLIDVAMRDAMYGRAAREVMKRGRLDLLAVYFRGTAYVSHGFWKYYEPEPFMEAGWRIDEREREHLADVIPHYYSYVDAEIGEILELVPDDALIMVLSDHGFGPALGEFSTDGDFLSGNHRFVGTLILSGPRIRRGLPQRSRITHYDILPTLLFALDLPQARDLSGTPLLHYFADQPAREIAFVDTFDTEPMENEGVRRSRHDEEILEELRSLGYID